MTSDAVRSYRRMLKAEQCSNSIQEKKTECIWNSGLQAKGLNTLCLDECQDELEKLDITLIVLPDFKGN